MTAVTSKAGTGESIGRLLRRGLTHHRQGELADAATCYQQVLELDRNQSDALNLLGVLAQQLGNLELAVGLLRRAYFLAPSSHDIALNCALALAAAGELTEAIEVLDRAIELTPHSALAHLHRGNVRRRQQRLTESLADYEHAIALDPNLAEAHATRGATLFALGYPEGAEVALRRAVALKPEFGEAQSDLGSVLQALGRRDEAIDAYREAIRLNPTLADAHSNLGTAYAEAGRMEEAFTAYRQALMLVPAHVEALVNLGLAHETQGDYEAAALAHQAALVARPTEPAAHLHLGGVRLALGRPEEACQGLLAALERVGRRPDLLIGLGNAYKALGRLEEAAAAYEEALGLDSTHARAATNLGNVRVAQGRLDEAVECHRRAVALDPTLAEAQLSLGNALKGRGDFLDAIAHYKEAIRLRPEFAEAEFNIGNAWRELAEPARAVAAYDQALEIRPDYAEAHWNRALALLTLGDLARGWEGYEWRWPVTATLDPARTLPMPPWRGESLLGKRILVWREQGLGDELLFATCLSDLVRRGGQVTLYASARLVSLFARAFPSVRVVADPMATGDAHPFSLAEYDFQIPLGSLPRFLRTSPASFPPSGAYLAPEPAQLEKWRRRLHEQGAALSVGICWRSGMLTPERTRHYSSLPDWGPLFAIPWVQWVNLQYGECREELEQAERTFGVEIRRWEGEDLKNDLESVAALIRNLNVVVTAPTAVSSIAGAVGTPTFQLDSGSDWTVAGGTRSPWFPSVSVIRKAPGSPDWNEVIRETAHAVAQLAGRAFTVAEPSVRF